jgi:hypothetical protein
MCFPQDGHRRFGRRHSSALLWTPATTIHAATPVVAISAAI